MRLKNWSRRHDRFRVGYWRIFRKLGWAGIRHGTGIMFIYHSHPVDAYPSPEDLELVETLKWPIGHMIFVPGTEFLYY